MRNGFRLKRKPGWPESSPSDHADQGTRSIQFSGRPSPRRRSSTSAVIYFIYQTGSLGVGYWMPQIIKSLQRPDDFADRPHRHGPVRHRDRRHGALVEAVRSHWRTPASAAWPAGCGSALAGCANTAHRHSRSSSMSSFQLRCQASMPSRRRSGRCLASSSAARRPPSRLQPSIPSAILADSSARTLGVVREHTGSAVIGLLFLSGLVFVALPMTLLARLRPADGSGALRACRTRPVVGSRTPGWRAPSNSARATGRSVRRSASERAGGRCHRMPRMGSCTGFCSRMSCAKPVTPPRI